MLLCGIGALLSGIITSYFSYKWIREYRQEKYNPLRQNDGLFKTENYFKSYLGFVFGLFLIVISIFLIIADFQ